MKLSRKQILALVVLTCLVLVMVWALKQQDASRTVLQLQP